MYVNTSQFRSGIVRIWTGGKINFFESTSKAFQRTKAGGGLIENLESEHFICKILFVKMQNTEIVQASNFVQQF